MPQTPGQRAGLIKARAAQAEKRRLYELSLQPAPVVTEVLFETTAAPAPEVLEVWPTPGSDKTILEAWEPVLDALLRVNDVTLTDSNLEAERRRALRTLSVNDLVTILVRLGKLEGVPDAMRGLNPSASFDDRELLISSIIEAERR